VWAVAALGGAGVLLLSRRLHSRDKLGLVDWPLLVLFLGLFVVNGALAETGVAEAAVAALRARGIDLAESGWLLATTVALEPRVERASRDAAPAPRAGTDGRGLLALASTLAGNLVLVGSIANLIVVDAASRHGIPIPWRRHARTGIPITLLTLLPLLLWGRS
jgi:Na+/H+ antiporter NhaD/arsenite permease-like protein